MGAYGRTCYVTMYLSLLNHPDQVDQLLHRLAPIWPYTQVSLPSINSTWGDSRKEKETGRKLGLRPLLGYTTAG